jgi:UDP-3-O-[3-hydroxymyristoyl] glucosamine N-acyltransferase
MAATLAELAERFGCELYGPGDLSVARVATLAHAGADAVAFLANPVYRKQLAETHAGAVILMEPDREACPVAALVTSNPYAVYARVAAELHPAALIEPGIHATASVAPDAEVDASAQIAAHTVIGAGACIGAAVLVGPGTIIGARARIGNYSRLAARVSVLDDVLIGERCIVHSGAVIGADGFGFAREERRWVKVPQIGRVVIGDDVEIGANTTIDRGTIEDTVIEDGVKLDNLIQVAHNVVIGAHTAIAACVGIAGSTRVGKRCMIGGAAVIVGHLEICDDVMVGFHGTVTRSIRAPGVYSGCIPVEEAARWRRNVARFKSLDEQAQRLGKLERRVTSGRESSTKKEGEKNE